MRNIAVFGLSAFDLLRCRRQLELLREQLQSSSGMPEDGASLSEGPCPTMREPKSDDTYRLIELPGLEVAMKG